jgi:hypothetical protein
MTANGSRALEIGARSSSSVNSILKNNLDRRRSAMPADVLVRKTAEWVQSATQLNNTGHFDPRARRYVISKNKLRHFLISKYGAAPAELN